MDKAQRGEWSSRLGFIFAAAGSAIGLGNIWKFPAKVGAGGGGAFIIVYFAIVFTIGISLMLTELTLGKATRRNTVGAFLATSPRWAVVGYAGIICGGIVLSYYSIIGGQVLKYVYLYAKGADFAHHAAEYFQAFVSHPVEPILWGLGFLALTGFIVMRGVSGGIERASKLLMPALLILLIIIMISSLTMPGARAGVEFLTHVDFSALTPHDILAALGQALFSLSIGLGTTCTYGSYLKKDENLVTSSFTVCVMDTLIALIAAFTIIPAVFSTGTQLGSGGAFAFVALPGVFAQMAGGVVVGALFYILLSFAALTSAIALLEGVVAYLVEQRGMTRTRAVAVSCTAMAAVGAVYSISLGALPLKGVWYTLSQGVTFPPLSQALELLTDNLLIPLGSLGFCLFVGWKWGAKNAVNHITCDGMYTFPMEKVWVFTVKYLAPAVIIAIFLLGILGIN